MQLNWKKKNCKDVKCNEIFLFLQSSNIDITVKIKYYLKKKSMKCEI